MSETHEVQRCSAAVLGGAKGKCALQAVSKQILRVTGSDIRPYP